MKNREYTVVKVYTQANGKKIAVSMLHTSRKGYYDTIKPTAEIEKYGKIEGVINSFWGKLPVVLVPAIQFASLKKEYETVDYRGPVECIKIRESKPRPDAAALKLYKVFAADAAAPQVDADGCPVKITVDGYSFPSGAGESLLKALKSEYSFTKADIAAAYALTLDNTPATDKVEAPAEPAAAPVAAPAADAAAVVEKVEEKAPAFVTVGDMAVPNITPILPADPRPEVGEVGDRVKYKYSDIEGTIKHTWYHDIYLNEWRCTVLLDDGKEIHPSIKSITILPAAAPVVDAPADDAKPAAAPLVQAAKETGHLIVCSVPKAEQPAAPIADAPTADAATPSGQKTETTPTSEKTAADEYIETGAYPIWYVRNLQIEHVYNRGKYMGTATENIGTVVSWGRKQIKVAWVTGKKNVYTIRDFFEMVESGKFIVSMPYDAEYMAKYHATLNQKQPTPAPAATDAQPATSDIKESHEAMKQPTGADAFAEAITAYCAAMEEPAVPVCYPEVIILKEQPAAATTDAAPAPRRRHLNIIPRLSRWLHPARWVAVAFVVCLLCGLLMGTNASTAATDATDAIAAVHELPAITVTASSLTTAPAANGLQPTLPDGLTICAGTAWAYTMMNWA